MRLFSRSVLRPGSTRDSLSSRPDKQVAKHPDGSSGITKGRSEPAPLRRFFSWSSGKKIGVNGSASGPASPEQDSISDTRPRPVRHERLPSNLTIALQAAKDLGEIAENFPFIKAIAGLSVTLIKMWEEIEALDELVTELLGRVADRFLVLVEVLETFQKDGSGQLRSLEKDLSRYEQLLLRIETQVKAFRAIKLPRQALQRTEIRESLDGLVRELKHSDELFTFKRLCDLVAAVAELRKANSTAIVSNETETLFEDPLPPPPTTFLGRETEKAEIVHLCISRPNPHVAILGTGGMGKTTLARAVLNDPAISSSFEQVIFVSCEQVTDVLGILKSIADVLAIPSHERGPSLKRNVMSRLRSTTTLLCLDNFEDPWEPPSTRSDVERFLQLLSGVARLGLLLTMRGVERPSQVDWTHPLPLPLLPLPNESALELFYRISGAPEDDRIPKLLEQVENIPLIIELLARQINPPLNDLDTVLQRWAHDGLSIFNRKDESDKRLTSVTKSIDLSLQSPRILNIPHIYDALRMVAALPDGLSDSTIPLLQARLPSSFDLRHCLQVLVQTSLCNFDAITRRYRLLAPIRQHVEAIIPFREETRAALIVVFWDYAGRDAEEHFVVAPELGNIRICLSFVEGAWDQHCIDACVKFLWWEGYLLGICDVELAFVALSHAQTPVLQAICRTEIARLYEYSCQYAQAEWHLRPALSLDTGSPYWNGHVQLQMGGILLHRNSYDEAELCLTKAAELFQQAEDQLWEGRSLEFLGTLLRDWGRLSEAEGLLERSLWLARTMKVALHEGLVLSNLGELYRLTNRMPEAEDLCQLAIRCAQRVHSGKNEGIAQFFLAEVYCQMGTLERAEQCYLRARHLYHQAHTQDGEALADQGLGRVYSQMEGRSHLAQEHFESALAIFTLIYEPRDQAITHKHFGRLLLNLGRRRDALIHFILALAFHLRRLHRSQQRFVPGILKFISHALGPTEGETMQPRPD